MHSVRWYGSGARQWEGSDQAAGATAGDEQGSVPPCAEYFTTPHSNWVPGEGRMGSRPYTVTVIPQWWYSDDTVMVQWQHCEY